jgi:hypothetical protein
MMHVTNWTVHFVHPKERQKKVSAANSDVVCIQLGAYAPLLWFTLLMETQQSPKH